MNTSKPIGRRFTDVYRERGPRVVDSTKFRRRLAYKIAEINMDYAFAAALRSETGHPISLSAPGSWWVKFLEALELDEALDFITTLVIVLDATHQESVAGDFVDFVGRLMDEENMAFEMDEAGGVHHRVDHAFQQSRAAAIDALNSDDAIAAREAFQEAHQALSKHPADTLSAVRRGFDAVENLFKIKYKTSRLGASEIKSKLHGAGAKEGAQAKNAAGRLNEAFAEWVNACHQFRHASGEVDPSPPPRWLAIAILDGASTYIRYLAAL